MQAHAAQRNDGAPHLTTDPRAKLLAVEDELNASVLERKEEVRSLLLALVTGEHLLLLGSPDTAKSALSRALCDRIGGGSYFSVLLPRNATFALAFGSDNLAAICRTTSATTGVSGRRASQPTAHGPSARAVLRRRVVLEIHGLPGNP